ncbi:MAG: flagellar motor protein MotB [Roseiarcus sp.]
MSEHHAEIVIIKRKGGHESGHHGGAWKIAFADFMTAMMAFFLVLWIINATDKDTKTVIARYFNPVKLENPARARKGVHGMDSSKAASDDTKGDQGPSTEQGPKTQAAKDAKGAGPAALPSVGPPPKKDEKPKTPAAEPHPEPSDAVDVKPTMSETALFSDPYKSLDKIAAAREADTPGAAPDTGAAEPVRKAGSASLDAFRDPFKPVGPGALSDTATMETDVLPPPTRDQRPDLEPQGEPTRPASADNAAATRPEASRELAGKANPTSAANAAEKAAAAQLELELAAKLGPLARSEPGPAVDVRVSDGGLLISLTDKLNFSMFAIGSAEPRPQLISAMNAIARLLEGKPGQIVVGGHTDARPYRSATYDNWRLSSARAQMAYYMLSRAGVPEARFDRIEGYGDHQLSDPRHPLAAENRRIEILLREPKS